MRTDYTPHNHPFKDDEIVRLKSTGELIRIESINPDPDFDVTEETWADASTLGGYNNVELDGPHQIEKSDWDEATVPKIAEEVASALHGAFGRNLSVSETELDGDNVLVTAHWDGAPLTFAVTVYDLEIGS